MTKKSSEFSGIVLAAGYSSRMKDWKPELKIGGLPIIISTVKPMLEHCVSVVIVGGFNFEKLTNLIFEEEYFSRLQKEKIKLAENKNFPAGMFSSLKKGLLEADLNDGIFITPGDIPLVKSSTYSELVKYFKTEPENSIFIPVSKVEPDSANSTDMLRKGHPVLIRKSVVPEIINRPDSSNLRDILEEFETRVCIVNDQGIFIDVDDRADLERAKQLTIKN